MASLGEGEAHRPHEGLLPGAEACRAEPCWEAMAWSHTGQCSFPEACQALRGPHEFMSCEGALVIQLAPSSWPASPEQVHVKTILTTKKRFLLGMAWCGETSTEHLTKQARTPALFRKTQHPPGDTFTPVSLTDPGGRG